MLNPKLGPGHTFFSAADLKNTALFLRGAALFQKLHARLPAWAWGLALLALLGLTSQIAGGGQTSATGLSAGEPANLLALGISVLFKLGLVIVLIYASMIFLRRWRASIPSRPNRQISVLETARLSPRQAIHLVQVKDQVLLIGATDQGLSLLTEFDAPAGERLPAPAGQVSLETRLDKQTSEVLSGCGKAPQPPVFGSLLASPEVYPFQQAQEAP
jgi:flagellar biosynthetic protein FliO